MLYSSENIIHEILKPCKNPFSSLSIINPNSMKKVLALCIFAAFSLFFISSFSQLKWPLNCPECNHIQIHPAYRRFSNGGREQSRSHLQDEEKTNISHILFGIGGSAETWGRRRHYCELWWEPNATRGFVWLDKDPASAEPWPETSPPYRVSGDTARFKYTNEDGSRAAVRLARIVKESFELGLEGVRWFVMGDDDTVFFTENLVSTLDKYDHTEMYYIGGISESVEQDLYHSYAMAYGGAGFAISYPLAAALVRVLDGCIDRYAEVYGSDQKVGACVGEIGVPLTRELGFHQMDIRGSPYGLLSAHPIAPLISLHHLDYIQPLFPGTNRVDSIKKLTRAYKSDPSRIVQNSFCYDPTRNWSISISWGYNIQLYPYLVSPKDLSTPLQTFLTWGSWSQEPFTFNTRFINLNPCERPVIYYFGRVNGSEYGKTTTSYTRPNYDRRRQCEEERYTSSYLVKEFNVSADVLDREIWKKGLRRQCCEIINGSDEEDGIVQVRIKGCDQWESVTPP